LRIAVISDVHANLEALEAVLAEIDTIGVEKIVSSGDLVGYNADPNAVVERMKALGIHSILGNHDAVACGIEEPVGFNPIAKRAALWTREEMTRKNREYLAGLSAEYDFDGHFCMVHGSLVHRDSYIFSSKDIAENFSLMKEKLPAMSVCFFGHTHYQVAYGYHLGEFERISSTEFPLQEGQLYLINPGSVGQPRDHDSRAAFLVVDFERMEVAFRRIEYDIEACRDKILANSLPVELANRLLKGW